MKIKADQEANDAIVHLCDIALKTKGLEILDGIKNLLDSIVIIKESETNTKQ